MYTCIWNIYIYICIYIYIYIYIYVFMYVYAYIYIYESFLPMPAESPWHKKLQTPKDFKTLLHVKSSTCVFCEHTATHSRAHTYTHTHRRVRFQMWVNVLQTHEKCHKITTFSVNVWRWKDTYTYVYQRKKTCTRINQEIHKYVSKHEKMHIYTSLHFLNIKCTNLHDEISQHEIWKDTYIRIFSWTFLKKCIYPYFVIIYCHLLILYISIFRYCMFASL